jgi:hypothetical protein
VSVSEIRLREPSSSQTLDCWNAEAAANRERKHGAHLWMLSVTAAEIVTYLDISTNTKLGKFFPGEKIVQSGVCSLRLRDSEQPWIVCPRRLSVVA